MRTLPMIYGAIMLCGWIFPPAALAIEVAQRITDREIIEQLTLIKAGQEKLSQRLDDT
ncbi:MAG: hypothetical protein HQL92_08430, partial [Magnetococcales bacterium]|nr:hypothetical protein [Magnetococcales bacterium]